MEILMKGYAGIVTKSRGGRAIKTSKMNGS
jgi:hypothetical protein